MRRSIYLVLFVITTSFIFSGCAMPPRLGVSGGLYTGTSQGLAATAQMSIKKGEACAMSILGIIATGDASIDAARRNGGIRSISAVDEEYFSILGKWLFILPRAYSNELRWDCFFVQQGRMSDV